MAFTSGDRRYSLSLVDSFGDGREVEEKTLPKKKRTRHSIPLTVSPSDEPLYSILHRQLGELGLGFLGLTYYWKSFLSNILSISDCSLLPP
ncbi:MAG: hypothetical protein HC939_13135 [Pleurocapsa sp. SU_5_0]|nr:hypothetical protein [Pleurocapsa sp. SU_5_0]